jgi:hypothetical protein
MKWFIEYKVEGFGDQVAGPYKLDDAQSHLSDISGYEGVKNARLVSEDEHICHPCI